MVTELQRERKEMEGSFRLHSLIDKAEETDSRLLQISVQIQEIKDTLISTGACCNLMHDSTTVFSFLYTVAFICTAGHMI